jgi:hypothetical protein
VESKNFLTYVNVSFCAVVLERLNIIAMQSILGALGDN